MDWRSVSKVPSSLAMPDMFLASVHPGALVLDVGCGEAGAASAVEEAGGRYMGLDVNLPSLGRARSAGRMVVAGEGGRLPFRAGVFDLVMLRAVLTVLVERAGVVAALREALRVCKGAVGVQDFLQTREDGRYAARYAEGVSLGRESGVFPVRPEEGGEVLYWARHFTPIELREMFREAGGQVVEMLEAPAPTRSGNIIRGVTLLASP